MSDPVHIFFDVSNIWISGKNAALDHERGVAPGDVRLSYGNLIRLARFGRPMRGGLAVGSVTETAASWERPLRDVGLKVELKERGVRTGREQGVDESLQLAMIGDGRKYASSPGIAVLLTGDGSGHEDGIGFLAELERLRSDGWGIEVVAWSSSCSAALREFAEAKGSFVALERYYRAVTFIRGGRPAGPLSLTHRSHSVPTIGSVAA